MFSLPGDVINYGGSAGGKLLANETFRTRSRRAWQDGRG
jgi:hypothetical protein